MLFHLKFVKLDFTAKRLWQIGSTRGVDVLEPTLFLKVKTAVIHFFQIFIQVCIYLAKATVEHLSSFKHVENAISEDLVCAMDDSINLKSKLILRKVFVHMNVQYLLNIKRE